MSEWTKKRHEELKILSEKASPRPWSGDRYDGTIKYKLKDSEGNIVLVTDHKNCEYGFIGSNEHDEPFVIYACNSISDALAEIERLQSKLTRLTDFLEKLFPGAEWLEEVKK